MRQYSFSGLRRIDFHGGEHSLGKRKERRPLSPFLVHHVIFRAEENNASFLNKRRKEIIQGELRKWSKRYQVRIRAQSINSNHIHLAVEGRERSTLQNFFRVLPSQISQKLKKKGKLWKHIVFTRIVAWGKSYYTLLNYIERNTLEAAGLIRYEPRKKAPPKKKTTLAL